ncbi:hypothetical protein T265_08776 [Opisthorchis viverrini]|uniref:Uncharacterized protein n=1 Tax=Opisthorchis viverrini TaxID=6198 RepID=A0A074ZCJ7_OPIVI|nr:hypothetical protein T265_08776 [Opisthorchis viverrini]KER23332.1 hypothetical protein T265_08776 [Opisthorchis viverrini]
MGERKSAPNIFYSVEYPGKILSAKRVKLSLAASCGGPSLRSAPLSDLKESEGACGKNDRSDSVTATVKTDEKKQNKRPLKSELRRYSIQCLTEHESAFKAPRPSLYGYPLIPSEESKEVTPQMKAIRKEEPVKLTRESVAFRCDTCQQSSMTITTYHGRFGVFPDSVLHELLQRCETHLPRL